MRLLTLFGPDLIVLDVLLANENGIDWCKNVRRYTKAPIVLLSNREQNKARISDLPGSGDDYITKPFSPGVLMTKIKSLLRSVSTGRRDQLLKLPGLTLNYDAQSVNMDSETILLSKKEFNLLSYLAQNVNRPVSVDSLFQLVWEMESIEDTRSVAVHISNLRRKIEADPANPERIVTIRGSEYMLVAGSVMQA